MQRGGTLELEHTGDNKLHISLSLKILSGTISRDAQVSISLDDTQFLVNLDVVFSPHGVTFSQPAILNIEAEGLDLGGINPDVLDIYYDNQEKGQWEPMPRDQIKVDVNGGKIVVKNARLPHFSRYAVAWSR